MATRAAAAPELSEQIFIDLETMNSPNLAELVEKFTASWEAPGNLRDPDKLAARRDADVAKFVEKAALLPEAPIAIVAVLTATQMFQFHSLKREKPRWDGNRSVTVEGFAGEQKMLEATCALLADVCGPETLIVAHNAYSFDLPRLRLGCLRNGIALPPALQLRVAEDDVQARVFDTMVQFSKRILGQQGPGFISQDEMLVQLGIRPLSSANLTGADVPRLLAEGRLDVALLKNRADLLDLRKAFLRMVGRPQ